MNAAAVAFAAGLDPEKLRVRAFATPPPLGSLEFVASGVWRRKRRFSTVSLVVNRSRFDGVAVDETLVLAMRAETAMARAGH